MIDDENEHERATDRQESDELHDSLISAWHRHRMRERTSSFYSDPQFAEWLANDIREQNYEGASVDADEAVSELASNIHARVTASRSNVKRIFSLPEYQTPLVPGSPHQVAQVATDAHAAPFLELGVAAGVGRELWDEECSTWVRLPSGIPKGSYVALKVSGESMMPLLHSGDVMVVRLDSASSPGDIVVARVEDDGFVVKRVGRVTRESAELLSINPAFGSIRVSRAGQPIVGVVVLCWCEHQEALSK